MIAVVNKRDGVPGEYIGRPSPLGNPFSHLKHSKFKTEPCKTRDEAIEKYRGWIMQKLQDGDLFVSGELRRLHEILAKEGRLTLVCWCRPSACHGDIISEILTGWEYYSGLFECLRGLPPGS